jgi:predicted permease
MRTLKHAARVLLKTPFVTAIAVLSLALGIGANTAIYSLFDQLLLRPLPVPAAERLVNLSAPGPKSGSTSCNGAGDCEVVFSYPMYRDLERTQTVLTGLAAHRSTDASLLVRGDPMTGTAMLVSGSYFPTLQLAPALGRLLAPADDEGIGTNYVAVLSHAFWESRFGADSAVLDQTIVINGHSYTIVGVAPRGFEGTTAGTRALLFVPISMRGQMEAAFRDFENRRSYWIYAFGRLKDTISIDQARAAINALYRPIINDVEAPLQQGMSEQTLARFRTKQVVVDPGSRGQSDVQTEARTPLILLFCVTGVVLLIACANIANLLLARGATRAMEMGVRLALGAGRWQLVRQLLAESLLLAALGAVASMFVAQGTLGFIASMLPADAAASLQFGLAPRVLIFAAALAIGTGLLFGMFPALHSTRGDLVTVIRSNAGQIAGGRLARRFRTTLVTVQIALSTALLISAGFFLKSLANVSRVDLGVRVDSVVTFTIAPTRSGYDNARTLVAFARIEEELSAIPGVVAVSAARVPLIAGSNSRTSVRVQGFASGPDVDAVSAYNLVGPGYLSVVGMRLLSGREFTLADGAGAPRVAVVNEAFVEKFGLESGAVGMWMGLGGQADSLNIQIVGVVRNAGYSSVKDPVPPVFFLPWRQAGAIGTLNYYVRAAGDPASVVRAIPAAMRRVDPVLPVEELKTMPQQIRETVFIDRLISIMSTAFALLATLLASIGLYGVLSYTVAQRTREIGVRMALGADARLVRGLVLRQMLLMTTVGGILGVAAAIGLGRAARALLFGLESHDPVVLALALIALCAVAAGAAYVPAQRAARVSPMHALRYE